MPIKSGSLVPRNFPCTEKFILSTLIPNTVHNLNNDVYGTDGRHRVCLVGHLDHGGHLLHVLPGLLHRCGAGGAAGQKEASTGVLG